MIKKDPVIEAILSDCSEMLPLYEREIIKYVQETEVRDVFGDIEDIIYSDPSLCAQLMSLGTVLFEFLRESRFAIVIRILENVEHQLALSDKSIHDSFEVCFFEGIMNVLSNQEEDDEDKIDKDRLYSLLGPISRELCRQNDEFWGTKIF